jgi:hypothetical protein
VDARNRVYGSAPRCVADPSIEQVSKPYERDVLAAILRRTLSARGGAADDRRTSGEVR